MKTRGNFICRWCGCQKFLVVDSRKFCMVCKFTNRGEALCDFVKRRPS